MTYNTKFKKPSKVSIQKHSTEFHLKHSRDPMYSCSIVRYEKLVLLFLGSNEQERSVNDLINKYIKTIKDKMDEKYI